MANLKQAPKLVFNGVKKLPTEKQTYQIPQQLADIVFNELGNASAQLRIMLVLIGTKEGFGVSEQWILDRTGLQHASYLKARRELEKRGWLSLDAAKAITVNFDAIYRGNTILPQNEEENRGNMVLPQRGNMVLPQRGNMVLPIIDKEIDKEIDNNKTCDQEEIKIQKSRSELDSMGCAYTIIGEGLAQINETGVIIKLID